MTKEEINSEISELKGWHVKQHGIPESNPNYCARANCGCWSHGSNLWYIYLPTGELISDMGYTTARAAKRQYYPDWHKDENWPILLREMLASKNIRGHFNEYGGVGFDYHYGDRYGFGKLHGGVDVASTVCEAWLKWCELITEKPPANTR